MLAVKEILFTLVKKFFKSIMVITIYIYSINVVPSNLQESCFTVHLEHIVKLLERFPFFSQHLQVEELTKGDVVSMMTPLVSKEDM